MSGREIAFTFLFLFAIAGMILLGDKALTAFDKWRERRARRIRDEQLRKWGITPWKPRGDQWLQ